MGRPLKPAVPLCILTALAGLLMGCGGAASADKTAPAPETPSGSYVVYRPEVKVLSEGQATVVNDGTAAMSVQGSNAQADLAPGQLFVSGGKAYRVESSTPGAQGMIVGTSEPAFEEVVEALHIQQEETPLTAQNIVASSLAPTVAMNQVSASVQGEGVGADANPSVVIENTTDKLTFTLKDFVIVDLDGKPSTTADEILANGIITLDKPRITLNVDWKLFQAPAVKLNFHAGESAELKVSTPAFAFQKSYVVPVAQFQVPVPGTVGAVTIGGQLNLYLDASGQIQAFVTFSQHAYIDAGLAGTGLNVKPYSTVDTGFSFGQPTIEGKLHLGAAIGPELNLKVLQYNVAGVNAKLGITADASATVTPASQCLNVGANGSLSVNAYFHIPFYSVDKELYNHTWSIYNQQFCH